MGNETIGTAELRGNLARDYHRIGDDGLPDDSVEPDLRLNGYVENLICAECNGGWIRRLEEDAGASIYGFVHAHDELTSLETIKRWMVYFAVKGAHYYVRTEDLASIPAYLPILTKVSHPGSTVELSLYVARIDVDPERWDFTYVANPMLIRDDPVMLRIVFCGVLFALADPEAPPPLEMAEAVEGLTLEDTQTISLAQTAKIFPRLL
jgi:hypothetical protein